MRILRYKNNNIYLVVTNTSSLTHRICSYGEVNGFWKVASGIRNEEGVFSVDIVLISDVKKVCSHLDLILE